MYGVCCDLPTCRINSLELHEPVVYTSPRDMPPVPKKLVSRHLHLHDTDGKQIREMGCLWGDQKMVPA